MSDRTAISVNDVSKAYYNWESPASRLISPALAGLGRVLHLDALRRKAAASRREFWALRDISFEVGKGEALGIIGRNGSGKSTLLQIICGTLNPTHGSAIVQGRVAALLELGSGFNPEFTGRENVYLNGAILGLSRTEVEAKFDQIAGFADIGDYIDMPVKVYSSGMLMRLAFAVQTAVDPDVLIVDEALSVGDVFFQQKCFERLSNLMEKGVTLLFVSHDSGSVAKLCHRALWLSGGRCVMLAEAQKVLRLFSAGYDDRVIEKLVQERLTDSDGEEKARREGPTRSMAEPESAVEHMGVRTGNGAATILGAGLYDENGLRSGAAFHGSTIHLRVSARANRRIRAAVGYAIRSRLAEYLASDDTMIRGLAHPEWQPGDIFTIRFSIKLPIMHPGDYTITVNVWDMEAGEDADKIQDSLALRVLGRERVHVLFRFEGSCEFEVPGGIKTENTAGA
jgi:lipopolysaccharide transport system ATP-binding protein